MSTRDVFDAVAPEYSSLSDDEVSTYLELAGKRLNAREWGANYQEAACLMAAHMIAMGKRAANMGPDGGPNGAPTSLSEGDQSISFDGGGGDTTTATQAALKSTSYGQRFLGLQQETITGPYTSED